MTAVGQSPDGLAISSDGRFLYVANFDSDSVEVIDAINNTFIESVPVASGPVGVSLSPDNQHAFVSHALSNIVTKINISRDFGNGEIFIHGDAVEIDVGG